MGFSLTQSSVIQYDSTLKLDFLFTYFHFEKISSFCSEIGHSRFCVASFVQLLEFSCAPDDFTAPRAQKRSLGRSLRFVNIVDIISLFAAELEEPKIGTSGKGLSLYHTIPTFIYDPKKEAFSKHCENKEKNALFRAFPQISAEGVTMTPFI